MCKADSKTIKNTAVSLISLVVFVMLQIISVQLWALPEKDAKGDCTEALRTASIDLKEDFFQPYKRFLTAKQMRETIQAEAKSSEKPEAWSRVWSRRIIYFKARSALLRQYVDYQMLWHRPDDGKLAYKEGMAKRELDKFTEMYKSFDAVYADGLWPGHDSFPDVFKFFDQRINVGIHAMHLQTLEVERGALTYSLTHAMKARSPYNNSYKFSDDFPAYHLLTQTIQSLINEIRDEMQFIRSRLQIEEIKSVLKT